MQKPQQQQSNLGKRPQTTQSQLQSQIQKQRQNPNTPTAAISSTSAQVKQNSQVLGSASSEYKILKIPITKDKIVFYYYRRYTQKSTAETKNSNVIVSLPEDRTIYVCHFNRPIDENFVQKFFGMAGKIKQVQIGEYKNKANNKRKRRTVYFAIITYKNASDCYQLLNQPKLLQNKVNLLTKKGVKFSENPFAKDPNFLNDQEESDEANEEEEDHKAIMQDGGFTMVTAAALNENTHGIKGKGSDGISTVLGISQEDAVEIYKQQMRKMNMLDEEEDNQDHIKGNESDASGDGDDSDSGDMRRLKYTTTSKKKKALMNDFYKFQVKDYKKQKLEEIREGFENDKRRLQKMMQKEQEKDVKNAKKE
eukprot:403337379